MASVNESREAERVGEFEMDGERFAARLAAVVFEWRLARRVSASPVDQHWMSRSAHCFAAARPDTGS